MLWSFVHGIPQYVSSLNAHAAAVSGTDRLYPGGNLHLNLTGSTMNIGIWDKWEPQMNHPEYSGRVTYLSDPIPIPHPRGYDPDHFTAVLGTLIAAGLSGHESARGMAYNGNALAYDWAIGQDTPFMASAALNGMLLSNHSYVIPAGFAELYEPCSLWHGDPIISQTEDYKFGYYDQKAAEWDELSTLAPHWSCP